MQKIFKFIALAQLPAKMRESELQVRAWGAQYFIGVTRQSWVNG